MRHFAYRPATELSHIINIIISIHIYIYIIRQDKLGLFHISFNYYKFVSYGKWSLPHSSGGLSRLMLMLRKLDVIYTDDVMCQYSVWNKIKNS